MITQDVAQCLPGKKGVMTWTAAHVTLHGTGLRRAWTPATRVPGIHRSSTSLIV
jgi:hypothetical protein